MEDVCKKVLFGVKIGLRESKVDSGETMKAHESVYKNSINSPHVDVAKGSLRKVGELSV